MGQKWPGSAGTTYKLGDVYDAKSYQYENTHSAR
jgi:hypothetical protein